MKKLLFLAILIVGFAFTSCHKDTVVPPTVNPPQTNHESRYDYINALLKPYKFDIGSYWVYQNDTNGNLDSVVVIAVDSNFARMPVGSGSHGGTTVYAQYINITMKSNASYQTYNDCLFYDQIIRSATSYNGYGGQRILYATADTSHTYCGTKLIARFPTMTINNHDFNNVMESKVTATLQEFPIFSNDTYFYFSDSIGLIKRVIDLGSGNYESWSILRWNVKR